MAHAAIAFWHHFHPWISMDAQKDILLKLLANNPDRIDFRVTLRTSWNLVQEQQFRSSSEAEIPQEKLGFPAPPAPTSPLEGGGGGYTMGAGGGRGPRTLDPGSYIRICRRVPTFRDGIEMRRLGEALILENSMLKGGMLLLKPIEGLD